MGKEDAELSALVEKGRRKLPYGDKDTDPKKRPYKKRNLGKHLDMNDEALRTAKKKIGDRLRQNYGFKFRFSFTKYTIESQKTLINIVLEEFKEEHWNFDQARRLILSMCEDRRKAYKLKRQRKQQ